MANNTVGITEPASPNKKLASQSFTRGVDTVHQEEISIGDGTTDGRVVTVTAANALKVDNSAVTQPVSATDLDIRNLVPAQDEVQARDKAQFDDVTPTLPAEDGYADLRLTANRGLHVNLRDAAGIETGTLAAPLRTRISDGTDQVLITAAGELNVLASAQPGVDVGDVTINNAAGASAVNVQDGGNSLTIDGSVSITGAVDTELEAAVALGDVMGNLTVPRVGAAALVFDGTNEVRVRGDVTNGVDVDVTRMAALVAGTANIGDVDIASPLGAGTEAAAVRVTVATDSTGVLSVDDNAGSLTIDGTVTANAGTGTFAVNVSQVNGVAVPTAGAGVQEVFAHTPAADVNPVSADGTARTLSFVRVNATADGDNVIIAAVGGQNVYVLSYVLTMTAAGLVSLQDTAATPVIHAQIRAGADGGGAAYANGPQCPAFKTAVGTGLEINNPAGVDTLGHITYLQY